MVITSRDVSHPVKAGRSCFLARKTTCLWMIPVLAFFLPSPTCASPSSPGPICIHGPRVVVKGAVIANGAPHPQPRVFLVPVYAQLVVGNWTTDGTDGWGALEAVATHAKDCRIQSLAVPSAWLPDATGD